MKRMLCVVAAALLMGADVPPDDAAKEVEKALATLNDAFKKQDAEAIKKLMTDDHTAVTTYYGGAVSRAEQVASLADLKLSEYTSAKTKVTVINKETALVTYESMMKGTFKGKPVPAKTFASAVWVKKDGRWLEAFYQETPLEGK
jgi:uncharacterized protein (TIGR02246 family)